QIKKEHDVPFKFAMVMPAFKGVDALMGIEGLVNPRGFVIIDKRSSTISIDQPRALIFSFTCFCTPQPYAPD
ncbi:MAG: hypothetical protein AB7U61_15330, partial [Methylocystis sp.]